jgi:hypothetical protein
MDAEKLPGQVEAMNNNNNVFFFLIFNCFSCLLHLRLCLKHFFVSSFEGFCWLRDHMSQLRHLAAITVAKR